MIGDILRDSRVLIWLKLYENLWGIWIDTQRYSLNVISVVRLYSNILGLIDLKRKYEEFDNNLAIDRIEILKRFY